MKDRYVIKKVSLLLLLVMIIVLINQIVYIRYDVNLYEYIKYSRLLSKQEKDFLKNKGTIIHVSDRNAPPISFVGEDKQYKGLVIDYVTALSIELGADIQFKPLIWEDTMYSLMNGNADICDIFPSEERSKKFKFSKPVYKLRGIIAVLSSEKEIKGVKDLEQKRVAVPREDYAIEHLNKIISGIQYTFTKDIYEALLLLQEGEVEAVVGDEPVISYFINEMGIVDSIRILDSDLYERDVTLAVPKSEQQLLNILNKGILRLKQKDFISKIQQRWFGIAGSIQKNKVTDNLIIGVGLFLIAMFILLFIQRILNNTLKKEVKRRTWELYQSRKELEITFNALSYFLVVVDINRKIINCNKSFYSYLGKPKNKVIGTDFCKWEILDYVNTKLEFFKDGKIKINDGEREVKYNHKYYIVNTYKLEIIEHRPDQILIVLKDNTDFKFIENQLLQENKMAAIGQLAAGVAHEIRNPLGLIRNYLYLLKVELADGNELDPIKVIEKCVKRIEIIINNLLNFSRISGERWTSIRIKDLISSILELQGKNMEKRNIEYNLICHDNLILYTNEESLKHIVLNLLDNSIQAIGRNGQISIECNSVELGIVIEFRDSGKGIKKEHLEYIFNPFYTTKAVGEGTGLGLYIVYNEVVKLGGRIKVNSEYNIGTIFEIFIPQKKR